MDKNALLKARLYCPDQPWNQDKAEELGPCVMKFMEDHEPFFARWAEVWYQNFQFIYGNQAVKWSRRSGYAVDYDDLQKVPALQMRAQTNLARVVAEALSSMIYASLPEWAVEAAEQSSTKGKRFKRIMQKLLDAYMVRLCMDKEFSAAAMTYVVFGQVFAQVDWDTNGGKLLEIPKWKKIKAPVFTDWMAPNVFTQGLIESPVQALDSLGNPQFSERWEAETDEMGRQIIDKMFAGDVRVDIATPFEIRREVGSAGPHKARSWDRIRLMDYDEWLDRFGDVPGKTKYYSSIRPVYQNAAVYKIAVRHFMRMQFTTPPSLNDMRSRPENIYRNSLFKNKVLVVEHYDAPHKDKWPLGRKLVITNGDCTHITVPTYSTNKLDGWHPFVEAQWMAVQPSSIATGPMNDVIGKNRELNQYDTLIATASRRNLGSQLLIKTGSGMDPQRFTGEPGIVHEVPDPYAARWLHDDMPIAPVIPNLRQMVKDDVYETSGAMDALRGDRTPGVTAGYALRQLQEREEKRLSPARKRFEFFVSGIGEKIFTCLKSNVVKLDDQVVGYLTRAASGEFQVQDVIAMLSSPMDYGVEVRVEESSMALKSKATMQATIQEMAKTGGIADRLSKDAKVLDEYLKFFDAEKLRDGSASHRDRAQRENELFTDMLRLGPDIEGAMRPIVLFEDDDDIHIAEHTEFELQNSEEIMKNEGFFQWFLQHMETHRLSKQEKAGALLPGTALQVPNMMSAARKSPTPTVQTIYQKSMIDMQQKQQDAQQPSAPQQSAPAGSKGPPQTSTSAPSEATPNAKMGPQG